MWNEFLPISMPITAIAAWSVCDMAVQLNPRYALALRIFAAALAMTGQIEDAKDVMRQQRDIDPDCTIKTLSERLGYPKNLSGRFFEGLRRAGMPE